MMTRALSVTFVLFIFFSSVQCIEPLKPSGRLCRHHKECNPNAGMYCIGYQCKPRCEPTLFAYEIGGHKNAVGSIAIHPTGQLFATGATDTTVKVWTTSSGKLLYTLYGHTERISSLVFHPDQRHLFSSSFDGTIRKWNIETGHQVYVIQAFDTWITEVTISPDGKSLLASALTFSLKLWDVDSGQLLNTLATPSESSSVRFHPDGKMFASGMGGFGGKGSILLWDTASRKIIKTLLGHDDAVTGIAFSPDGQTIASSSWDNTVRLWDISSGQTLHTLRGHQGVVWRVAFDPFGKYLASVSTDSTAFLWNISLPQATGLLLLREMDSSLYGVAFSPGGTMLAITTGRSSKLKIFTCPCQEGETRSCYNALPSTAHQGECRRGTQQCTASRSLFELECHGEVVPQSSTTTDQKDHNCDGYTDSPSRLVLSSLRVSTSQTADKQKLLTYLCFQNIGEDAILDISVRFYLTSPTVQTPQLLISAWHGKENAAAFHRLPPLTKPICLDFPLVWPEPLSGSYSLSVVPVLKQLDQDTEMPALGQTVVFTIP